MEAALTSGEDFLRTIIRTGVQDLANLIIPGSALGMVLLGMVLLEHAVFAFGKAGWSWLQ